MLGFKSQMWDASLKESKDQKKVDQWRIRIHRGSWEKKNTQGIRVDSKKKRKPGKEIFQGGNVRQHSHYYRVTQKKNDS